MRRRLVFIAMLTVSIQANSQLLEACGAKFLVATRAARFQRIARATHPANILVYQHNDDAGVAAFAGSLRDHLNDVGHTVTVVAGETALRAAARRGGYNIVMMQLEEAYRLKTDIRASLPEARILPMGKYVTGPAAAAAKEEFGHVLRLPAKTNEVLSVVQAAYK
jgi:hypothetical protein